jgi:acetolactate synthase-1/2/3 large subunit
MKVSTAVVKVLKAEGVEFITGFPSNPLFEAGANEGIRPIKTRTERVAVNIADGYTRATMGKRIGVCAMQYGPGIENAFAGVAQAYADSVPILLLPSGYARRELVPPQFSATRNYREVTKWIECIGLADRAPDLMRRAFTNLRIGRPGPVMLELPVDVAEEECGDGVSHYKAVQRARSAGDPGDVEYVARALVSAVSPVIRAGQGILYAGAWEELRELAELLSIPVLTTMNGKSAFPENHPLSLGTGGRTRPRAVMEFLKKADLVFAIGSSCTREMYTAPIPNGTSVIQSTVDERDINKDYPVERAILGDAKLVLRQLIEEVKRLPSPRARSRGDSVVREIRKVKDAWLAEWKSKLTSKDTPINPYRVVTDIMKALKEEDAIVTAESGGPRDQMLPFYESRTPGSYIGWGKTTTLGAGLGFAMGAKLARPEKTCVWVAGDAAIGMVGMDLETSAREKIPILTIVLNNGLLGGYRKSCPTASERYDFNLVSGDYAATAASLGAGYVENVTEPDRIVPAIVKAKDSLASGRPALVNIVTAEELSYSLYA